jgi:D-alanyl-D-alanine carboxypeptidase/D-alanyl-D-alanine-endopeptidase (penicillin-binding protein 4)
VRQGKGRVILNLRTPWLAGIAALALVTSVAAPAQADPSKKRLRTAIDRIVERPAWAHAFWGIEVRSLESGKTLYERNADRAFRPASTLKLVTTAAVLDAFGPEERLRTTVETAGRLDGLGRILGDVFFVGRGDPSLSGRFDEGAPTAAFEAMAEALVDAGVRRIEGRLVGHEGALAGDRRGADWMVEDLAWGYGAEVSALTFNDNVVHVILKPGERPGDPAVLEAVPRTSFAHIASAVVTGAAGTKEDVVVGRPLGSNRVLLSGVLPRGGEWEGEVAVEDPALFAVTVFGEVLQAKGVAVMGGVATSSDPLPSAARVLAAHDGVPMARLIAEVNKESQNLHAELLLRVLGLRLLGEGTMERGHEAVEEFLVRLEVPHAGWSVEDGSGLSHTNVVTPRGLAALLVAMDRHPQAAAFRASLAVAGVDGTLEDRMRGTPAETRVTAKTGGLKSVNALAGYVTTERGERLAFAFLVNNHVELSDAAKAALDDMAVVLATAR